ncbi:MAG: nucleotidyl transferase AbiEii/AbiGii toxin family protein [Spirochaetes bacterium]|nr:nucleotidyl transferase AbiEii/AbiGii toxin family protein [Spirochaetota bacterium]
MEKSEIAALLKKLLNDIIKAGVLPKDCYLAGGTAVYFYLNHRLSRDLDFFSLNVFHSEIILKRFENHFEVKIEILEMDTIIIYLTKEKIKFSLFHYPYPLLNNLHFKKINNHMECPIASFLDIIAMKIIAIVQRGSAKDFIDLFFLLEKMNLQFHEIVGLVKKKYGVEDRYEYQIKTAITYFDDADQEVSDIYLIDKKDNLEMISEKNWNDIKYFFIEFAR